MINAIEETNFSNAWYKALQHVLKHGTPLTFGVDKKEAIDSTQVIELTGRAITQVLNGEIHPMSTFKALASYKKEFTYDYLLDYVDKQENEKFDYLYMERLAWVPVEEGCAFDQIHKIKSAIKEQKETQTPSNYCIATTWNKITDGRNNKSSPCLQIIQCRWNQGDLVDIHYMWRSRDLYNAWQANIIALTDMINREVVAPNKCKIARINDYSTSLHIYKSDIEQAKRVNMVWAR